MMMSLLLLLLIVVVKIVVTLIDGRGNVEQYYLGYVF